MSEFLACLRVVAVIACLCAAAAVATPKGRLPLALRGVRRILRKDLGAAPEETAAHGVSLSRRVLSAVLIAVALVLAIF